MKDINLYLKSKFSELEFDEVAHRYTLRGENLISVSAFTHQWDVSDFDEIAKQYAKKHGGTAEEWRAKWDEKSLVSCNNGTFAHEVAESLVRLRLGQSAEECPNAIKPLIKDGKLTTLPGTLEPEIYKKCIAAKTFLSELPENEEPVAVETRVYTSGYKKNYAGTFDLLVYDKERDGYIIYDYKTNANLEGNIAYIKFLKAPFLELTEDSLGHYTLQQSCYQIPLEDAGIKILERNLVWLKEDGNYEIYSLPNFTDKIRKVLNEN